MVFESSSPKQPQERLRYEGINYTVDNVVLSFKNGEPLLLLIKRKSGDWAMPGGFRDVRMVGAKPEVEDIYSAAARELTEETGGKVTGRKDIVYQGRVEDPRNEDDRYIETAVVFSEESTPFPVIGSDDADEADWVSASDPRLRTLFEHHRAIIISSLRVAIQRGLVSDHVREVNDLILRLEGFKNNDRKFA